MIRGNLCSKYPSLLLNSAKSVPFRMSADMNELASAIYAL